MKNYLLLFIFAIGLTLSSQAQVNLWKSADISDVSSRTGVERYTQPSEFGLYKLSLEDLRAELHAVPHEKQINARNSYATFSFPMPDGSFRTFNLVEYEMIEAKLMRKYPHMRAYTGVDEKHGSKIHMNLTKDQFFAVIRENGVTYYIDPYFRDAGEYYVSYDIRDDIQSQHALECQNHKLEVDEVLGNVYDPSSSDELFHKRGEAFTLRTYRLAVTATSGFASFHGGTVMDALDAIATIVNRINSVYEREVAIRLILIARNDELIFTDPENDPFIDIPQGELGDMINQNQITTSSILLSSDYDIGHILSTHTNSSVGQGLAQRPCVCAPNSKARGASARPLPVGDAFTIAIICHEMGHQFSANHTMYHCHNVNLATSYSPGSGTTIMSYAGICSNGSNVINTSDDYFHVNSIANIINYSRVGGGSLCGSDLDFGNTYPDAVLDYPSVTYIPASTAFYLDGVGVDTETPNAVTYCWEQYNTGNRNFENNPWDISQPVGNEPIFRSRPPVSESRRYFPALPIVVNSSNYLFEQYPTYARDMKFRMTVRDNASENGGAAWEEMNIKVIDNSSAGLFEITNYNVKDTIKSGGYVELTWNVAETDMPPINTDRVNIRFSVDGGTSFPYLLKTGTPNDGSTFVNIPDTTANRFRFMVEAHDNIYYDVTNRSGLLCVDSMTEAIGLTYEDQFFQVCAPDVVSFDINTFGLGGFDDMVNFEISGNLPVGAVATFSESQAAVGTPTTLTVDLQDVEQGGTYTIGFTASGTGIETQERELDLKVTTNNFNNLTLNSPANGSTKVELIPTLSWNGVIDALSYTVELSTEADFSNVIFMVENTTLTDVDVDDLLDAGTVYFWRVIPTNDCGDTDINRVSSFQTKALSCVEYCSTEPSVFIPSATPFDAIMEINIGASQSPDEINVTEINGNHQQISDVNFILEGPDGTQVLLEKSGYCPVGTNMDFGFDDDAVGVFPDCSNPSATYNSGTLFQPEEPLSALNGIPGSSYKLIMNDENAGFGGRLDSWCFEICGAADVESASLINADSIHLPILSSRVVGSDKLEVSHPDYNASQLTITIVTTPNFGSLLIDGVPANIGAQLTMQDIADDKLAYQHENMSAALDQFTFIVTDPGGGFLGTPAIRFYVGGSAIENNLPVGSDLVLFPNPVKNQLNVELDGLNLLLDDVIIYNLHGQQISRINNINNTSVNIQTDKISSGLYILEARSGQYKVMKKFIKQ